MCPKFRNCRLLNTNPGPGVGCNPLSLRVVGWGGLWELRDNVGDCCCCWLSSRNAYWQPVVEGSTRICHRLQRTQAGSEGCFCSMLSSSHSTEGCYLSWWGNGHPDSVCEKQSRSKQTNQKCMAWWDKPTGAIVRKVCYGPNWPPYDKARGLLHNRESCLVLQTWSTPWVREFTVYSRKFAAVVLLNGHNLPFKIPSNNYAYSHRWVLLFALVKNASNHSEEWLTAETYNWSKCWD